jgi:WD40 repeat protein
MGDLKEKKKTIINRDAHVWSAYFIPHSNDFAWQDTKKVLHIENVNLRTLKLIPLSFYVYGLVMTSNHKYFMAGDISDGLYWCKEDRCKTLKKPASNNPRDFLADMPYIFSILPDQKHVVESKMSGLGATPKDASGVYLWDIESGKILHDYIGNIVQTFATISPDGKYVVAGDNNSWQYVWDLKTGKRLVQILAAMPIKEQLHPSIIADHNVIARPNDLTSDAILAIKYIDPTHYLVFNTPSHYAVLYQTLNPKPIKYLNLGNKPLLATFNLERDQSMDTSPSAHVLVMAKDKEPGIIVYKYNPKIQTLKKVWDAS